MYAALAYLIALSQHLSAETKQNHKQFQHNSFVTKVPNGKYTTTTFWIYIYLSL
jgi:hypothetical protein